MGVGFPTREAGRKYLDDKVADVSCHWKQNTSEGFWFELLSFSHGHRYLSADRTVEDDENDEEQESWKLGGDGEREGSIKRKNIGGR